MEKSTEFYNLGKFQDLASGDDGFYKTLLEKFIRSTSEALDEIIISQKENDLAKLKAMVHKIKPSIEMLSVSRMPELIRSIQDENSDPDLAFKLSDELTEICTKLLSDLQQELNPENVTRF